MKTMQLNSKPTILAVCGEAGSAAALLMLRPQTQGQHRSSSPPQSLPPSLPFRASELGDETPRHASEKKA